MLFIFIGIVVAVFVLLGIEGQLKKVHHQNEEIIELLQEIKDRQ